jgi:hypothetical protein
MATSTAKAIKKTAQLPVTPPSNPAIIKAPPRNAPFNLCLAVIFLPVKSHRIGKGCRFLSRPEPGRIVESFAGTDLSRSCVADRIQAGRVGLIGSWRHPHAAAFFRAAAGPLLHSVPAHFPALLRRPHKPFESQKSQRGPPVNHVNHVRHDPCEPSHNPVRKAATKEIQKQKQKRKILRDCCLLAFQFVNQRTGLAQRQLLQPPHRKELTGKLDRLPAHLAGNRLNRPQLLDGGSRKR